MSTRLRYIDLAKGCAIILMLFAHTMTEINYLHIWIYSFHMPIFFIICGILIYEKQKNYIFFSKRMVMQRVYVLGIPYLFWGGILVIFYTLLDIIATGSAYLWKSRIFKLLTLQGIDSLWFIPVYIIAEFIVQAIRNNKWRRILAAVSFIVVSFGMRNTSNWWIELIYKSLIGICFIQIGIEISRYSVIDKINREKYVFLIGFSGLALINGPVEMSVGSIGNSYIYFWCATVISVSIMAILKEIEKKKDKLLFIIEKYGRNTIVILVTNNLLIEIERLIDYKITDNLLIRMGMLGSIIFTLVLLIIEWEVIKLANNSFSVVFGKSKKMRHEFQENIV